MNPFKCKSKPRKGKEKYSEKTVEKKRAQSGPEIATQTEGTGNSKQCDDVSTLRRVWHAEVEERDEFRQVDKFRYQVVQQDGKKPAVVCAWTEDGDEPGLEIAFHERDEDSKFILKEKGKKSRWTVVKFKDEETGCVLKNCDAGVQSVYSFIDYYEWPIFKETTLQVTCNQKDDRVQIFRLLRDNQTRRITTENLTPNLQFDLPEENLSPAWDHSSHRRRKAPCWRKLLPEIVSCCQNE